MITWVTIWVLTVHTDVASNRSRIYQLTYATQKACLKESNKHHYFKGTVSRCDFQQILVVVSK